MYLLKRETLNLLLIVLKAHYRYTVTKWMNLAKKIKDIK